MNSTFPSVVVPESCASSLKRRTERNSLICFQLGSPDMAFSKQEHDSALSVHLYKIGLAIESCEIARNIASSQADEVLGQVW